MRKVYYVPSHLDPEDYKEEWFGNTAEVHNSVSESNKDYILLPGSHWLETRSYEIIESLLYFRKSLTTFDASNGFICINLSLFWSH